MIKSLRLKINGRASRVKSERWKAVILSGNKIIIDGNNNPIALFPGDLDSKDPDSIYSNKLDKQTDQRIEDILSFPKEILKLNYYIEQLERKCGINPKTRKKD